MLTRSNLLILVAEAILAWLALAQLTPSGRAQDKTPGGNPAAKVQPGTSPAKHSEAASFQDLERQVQ